KTISSFRLYFFFFFFLFFFFLSSFLFFFFPFSHTFSFIIPSIRILLPILGGQKSNSLLSVDNYKDKSGVFRAEFYFLLMRMAREFTNLWG
ncbi:MAG: hypothetical protein E3J56_16435, partial [Candidatus Aminicenantes bacterium]